VIVVIEIAADAIATAKRKGLRPAALFGAALDHGVSDAATEENKVQEGL
jgi:hypothetical protein